MTSGNRTHASRVTIYCATITPSSPLKIWSGNRESNAGHMLPKHGCYRNNFSRWSRMFESNEHFRLPTPVDCHYRNSRNLVDRARLERAKTTWVACFTDKSNCRYTTYPWRGVNESNALTLSRSTVFKTVRNHFQLRPLKFFGELYPGFCREQSFVLACNPALYQDGQSIPCPICTCSACGVVPNISSDSYPSAFAARSFHGTLT